LSLGAEVVGVLGGTFDPVHLGHLYIADRVRRILGLSRVLLVPAAVPPHKHAAELSSAHHREEMVRLAVADRPGLEIDTLELQRGGASYTIDTLRALRLGPPPLAPLFLLGADALLHIESWREYQALLSEFDLIALDRPGLGVEALPDRLPWIAPRLVPLDAECGARALRELEPGRGGRIFHPAFPPLGISSSRVRRLAAAGSDLSELVPAAVARYIHRMDLYREEESP
jgi:nicotinate-nucleotide adenylyltransferase